MYKKNFTFSLDCSVKVDILNRDQRRQMEAVTTGRSVNGAMTSDYWLGKNPKNTQWK